MFKSLRRRFIKLTFHLLYHQFAFTYDAVAWLVSLGQWKAWGRMALGHVRGMRVLELGHGPGHLLIALARAGRSPVGVDLSPQMIAIARRRIRREHLDIPQVRCRAQALPLRSGAFDSVVAAFPTAYIVDPSTLLEVKRVTHAHSRLVIVAGAQLAGRQPSAHFIDWLYRVTGQSDWRVEEHASIFQRIGMQERIELEGAGAGTVTLVIAEKVQVG